MALPITMTWSQHLRVILTICSCALFSSEPISLMSPKIAILVLDLNRPKIVRASLSEVGDELYELSIKVVFLIPLNTDILPGGSWL